MAEKRATKRGEATRFLIDVVLQYDGNECLRWPFALHRNGYPKLKRGGKTILLHRDICEIVHGAPPTDEHEAAHECGDNACVCKAHIFWKTRAENEADKIRHKTRCRIPLSTYQRVLEMSGRFRQIDIAEKLCISQAHVSRIIRGVTSEAGRR